MTRAPLRGAQVAKLIIEIGWRGKVLCTSRACARTARRLRSDLCRDGSGP
jgi:hypothetical protein